MHTKSQTSSWRTWIFGSLFFAGAWGLGWWMGRISAPSSGPSHTATSGSSKPKEEKVTWTCSMHPQIKMPAPGKCAICAMDLIPLKEGAALAERQIELSSVAAALSEIQTKAVERRPLTLSVPLTGRIAYDETRVKTIHSWVAGRIDRLFVNFTGISVRKGEPLMQIYSPEVVAAQEEFLQALASSQNRSGAASTFLPKRLSSEAILAARRKLELLGMQASQIQNVQRQKAPLLRVEIVAPQSGIVVEKTALEGSVIQMGTPLYKIADLSAVWLRLDAFESDLPWLYLGQKASFSVLGLPGRLFEGRLVYFDPSLDPQARTLSLRVNASNPGRLLRPGMFAQATLQASLHAKGQARKSSSQGRHLDKADAQDPLVIPSSAPLITGRRALVYVRDPKASNPTYEGREILLGPKAGDHYVVLEGLKEGEEVVVHGAFRLDSELQIQGKKSMMSPSEQPSDHPHRLIHPPPSASSALPPLAASQPPSVLSSSSPLSASAQVSSPSSSLPPKIMPTFALSKEALARLDPIYQAYIRLQEDLASDHLQNAQATWSHLRSILQTPFALPPPATDAWATYRSSLYDAVSSGHASKDLAASREAFFRLTSVIRSLHHAFGHATRAPLFLAYCPMAFDNKGAHWLQREVTINNPYFGASMLRCGEIKKTLPPPTFPPASKRPSPRPLYRKPNPR